MSSMNFTCDVCGREVFSCTFVNGMKFCAKCYQETFGETDKDRKIADLEAKLAESEKKNFELVAQINLKEHKPAFCTLADRDCEALGQVAELKQQLVEKEEEIEELQKDYEFKDKDCAINLERFCDALTKNVQLEFLIKDLQSELKSQPAEIVEKIGGEIYTRMVVECKETKYTDINLILNTILKEYREKL